jgi:hypothetical protein
VRAVGKLGRQLVRTGWQGHVGFGLALAKVHVLVAKRYRLAGGDGVQVDQQVVVSAVGHNLASRGYVHAFDAKTHLEGGGYRGVVGGLQDREGLRWRHGAGAAGDAQYQSGSCKRGGEGAEQGFGHGNFFQKAKQFCSCMANNAKEREESGEIERASAQQARETTRGQSRAVPAQVAACCPGSNPALFVAWGSTATPRQCAVLQSSGARACRAGPSVCKWAHCHNA